jgi:heme/copper-type cytochrome/quinol oxidase subunit 2
MEKLFPLSLKRRHLMSKLAALIGFIFVTISSAWAQTPTPAPGTTPGTPPAGDATATGGGIMDYWWVILVIIIVIAAIVYFSRRGRRV